VLRARLAEAGACGLVFALALGLYCSYGLNGYLPRDHANCLYAGQRAAAGVPPFVSMFTMGAPMSQLLAELGVRLSHRLHTDDLRTTRALYLAISALAVAAAYRLGRSALDSATGGALTALALLSFESFARGAAFGPQKKTPMVLFEILALWLTLEGRWFSAGVAGGLCALTWQPMLVFPIVTLVVAAVREGSLRSRSVCMAALGFVAPFLSTVAYFQFHHALRPMLEGMLLFPICYLDRKAVSLASRAWLPVYTAFKANSFSAVPILVGLGACASFYRLNVPFRSFPRSLLQDRLAPLLLSLPAPLVWSFLDFQGQADLYPFFPYSALGFAVVVDDAARKAQELVGDGLRDATRNFVVGSFGLALLVIAAANVARDRDTGLGAQQAAVEEMERRFGNDARLLSVGAPEALVLLHRVNPNPYPFIVDGIDNYIDAKTEGGFDGFVRKLESLEPDVIAFGATEGRHTPKLIAWMRSRYRPVRIGPMTFFVRRKGDRDHAPDPEAKIISPAEGAGPATDLDAFTSAR
jgi:hypothetical protein